MNIYNPTSEEDIINILNGNINVMKYSDLKKYESIFDVFYPHDGVIILYESSHGTGHWVLIYVFNGIINFFDSYGFKYPNDEINYINPYFNDRSNKMLLYDLIFQYPVYHNDINYQSINPAVKSCGLWCCARYILRDMSPEEFEKEFHILDSDLVVAKFIYLYLTEI